MNKYLGADRFVCRKVWSFNEAKVFCPYRHVNKLLLLQRDFSAGAVVRHSSKKLHWRMHFMFVFANKFSQIVFGWMLIGDYCGLEEGDMDYLV